VVASAARGAVRPDGNVAGGNVAGERTRARLITAGERLFAKYGLDAVSVRDITAAAKANTAAVHYHFGSKRGLIEAILEARAAEVGRRRGEFLDRIEATPKPTLRDVVAALVIPTAEMARDRRRGGYYYVGFLSAVLSHPEFMPAVNDAVDPHTSRYLVSLATVTPHLSPDVRVLRHALAKDMVNRVFGQPGGAVHLWLRERAPSAEDDLVDRVIDFLCGAFAARETA
jgi:AcrR family transcriptional regulator